MDEQINANQILIYKQVNFQTWFCFLAVIILLLRTSVRFVNLDEAVYWEDETFTSLRIAGYSRGELDQLFDGRVISIDDLQQYQQINPDKSIGDTISSLADDVHPPLYFLLARLWVNWFGDSVKAIRSFSALISLLTIPCIYWLCRELFKVRSVGLVASTLVCVSPFYVLLAREARMYSLWTVTILLSSAALIRAMRYQSWSDWGLYTITLALGFYTHWFSALVAAGHGIYVFGMENWRWSKTFKAFLLSCLAVLVILFPWLLFVNSRLTYIYSQTKWTAQSLPLFRGEATLVKKWAENISSIFLYLNISENSTLIYWSLPILVLIGYSLYWLCKYTSKQVWLFVLTLIGVNIIVLVLPDLILGGQTSGVNRYLIPCCLGIQLAISHLFTAYTNNSSAFIWRQKIWQLTITTVLTCSLISSVIVSLQLPNYWSKGASNLQASRIVNQETKPLLLFDNRPSLILPFCYLLKPQVHLQLLSREQDINLAEGFNNIFLYQSSNRLKSQLQNEY